MDTGWAPGTAAHLQVGPESASDAMHACGRHSPSARCPAACWVLSTPQHRAKRHQDTSHALNKLRVAVVAVVAAVVVVVVVVMVCVGGQRLASLLGVCATNKHGGGTGQTPSREPRKQSTPVASDTRGQ